MSSYLCDECLRRYVKSEMFDDHYCKQCAKDLCLTGIVDRTIDMKAVEERKKQVKAEDKAVFDAQAEAKRELADRELARRHLLAYVNRMVDNYEAGWVHAEICQKLEQFERDIMDKKSPRLMLFLPPRAGKSELGSKRFPAWFLGHHPELDVIISSYSGDLAEGFSRSVRNSFMDEKHMTVFPNSQISQDSKAAAKWNTKAGGSFNAVGVSGSLSGKGGSLIIVDDPHKDRQEAESQVSRAAVIDWYSSTLSTRQAPRNGILVILTRWHVNDLAGYLLEQQKKNEKRLEDAIENGDPITEDMTEFDRWQVVSFPAIATEDEPFRKKGEALDPNRFPLPTLHKIKNSLLPRDWASLYQQSPTVADGDFFTRGMIRYYNANSRPPIADMRIIAACDLAISQKQTADYTVIAVFGVCPNNNYWLLDLVRGRFNSLGIIDQLFRVQDVWNPEFLGIETGQIELTLEPFIEKEELERGVTLKYKKLKTKGNDKQTRALPLQGRMEQGRVHFPEVMSVYWMPQVETELLQFPLGQHDDIVDALAWSIQMVMQLNITNRKKPLAQKKKSWKDKLKGYGKATKSAMSA